MGAGVAKVKVQNGADVLKRLTAIRHVLEVVSCGRSRWQVTVNNNDPSENFVFHFLVSHRMRSMRRSPGTFRRSQVKGHVVLLRERKSR